MASALNLPNDPLAEVLHEAYQRIMATKPAKDKDSETPILDASIKALHETQQLDRNIDEIIDAIGYSAALVVIMRDRQRGLVS